MGNKILERYILKKFLKSLFISLLGFLFIYIITNLFERIGYFIDRDAKFFDVIGYYLLFSPMIIVRLMPLAVLLGVYFSLGLVTKHNEVLAIRGLGVSPFMIYKPIFIYGFIISFLVFSLNLSFVPRTKHLLEEYKKVRIDKIKGLQENYAQNINYITPEGWIVKIKKLKGDRIFDANFFHYKQGKMVSRIYAKSGKWKDSLWILEDVHDRRFSESGEVVYKSRKNEKSKILKASPDELGKANRNPMNLAFTNLLQYVRRLEMSGQFSRRERVELLERISYPFMSFIILFFGCPLALEVKRRGLIFGFGLGLLASFTFWGIIQLFKELGVKGASPPSLSVFGPDIIFLSLGLYLLIKKKPF
ncbi:MAG: LptF/LptG family permease [candidate division WOR-3 bacterium]|nr:LptF/LptG family permease [candidate division WOR-3 bacterium]